MIFGSDLKLSSNFAKHKKLKFHVSGYLYSCFLIKKTLSEIKQYQSGFVGLKPFLIHYKPKQPGKKSVVNHLTYLS